MTFQLFLSSKKTRFMRYKYFMNYLDKWFKIFILNIHTLLSYSNYYNTKTRTNNFFSYLLHFFFYKNTNFNI